MPRSSPSRKRKARKAAPLPPGPSLTRSRSEASGEALHKGLGMTAIPKLLQTPPRKRGAAPAALHASPGAAVTTATTLPGSLRSAALHGMIKHLPAGPDGGVQQSYAVNADPAKPPMNYKLAVSTGNGSNAVRFALRQPAPTDPTAASSSSPASKFTQDDALAATSATPSHAATYSTGRSNSQAMHSSRSVPAHAHAAAGSGLGLPQAPLLQQTGPQFAGSMPPAHPATTPAELGRFAPTGGGGKGGNGAGGGKGASRSRGKGAVPTVKRLGFDNVAAAAVAIRPAGGGKGGKGGRVSAGKGGKGGKNRGRYATKPEVTSYEYSVCQKKEVARDGTPIEMCFTFLLPQPANAKSNLEMTKTAMKQKHNVVELEAELLPTHTKKPTAYKDGGFSRYVIDELLKADVWQTVNGNCEDARYIHERETWDVNGRSGINPCWSVSKVGGHFQFGTISSCYTAPGEVPIWSADGPRDAVKAMMDAAPAAYRRLVSFKDVSALHSVWHLGCDLIVLRILFWLCAITRVPAHLVVEGMTNIDDPNGGAPFFNPMDPTSWRQYLKYCNETPPRLDPPGQQLLLPAGADFLVRYHQHSQYYCEGGDGIWATHMPDDEELHVKHGAAPQNGPFVKTDAETMRNTADFMAAYTTAGATFRAPAPADAEAPVFASAAALPVNPAAAQATPPTHPGTATAAPAAAGAAAVRTRPSWSVVVQPGCSTVHGLAFAPTDVGVFESEEVVGQWSEGAQVDYRTTTALAFVDRTAGAAPGSVDIAPGAGFTHVATVPVGPIGELAAAVGVALTSLVQLTRTNMIVVALCGPLFPSFGPGSEQVVAVIRAAVRDWARASDARRSLVTRISLCVGSATGVTGSAGSAPLSDTTSAVSAQAMVQAGDAMTAGVPVVVRLRTSDAYTDLGSDPVVYTCSNRIMLNKGTCMFVEADVPGADGKGAADALHRSVVGALDAAAGIGYDRVAIALTGHASCTHAGCRAPGTVAAPWGVHDAAGVIGRACREWIGRVGAHGAIRTVVLYGDSERTYARLGEAVQRCAVHPTVTASDALGLNSADDEEEDEEDDAPARVEAHDVAVEVCPHRLEDAGLDGIALFVDGPCTGPIVMLDPSRCPNLARNGAVCVLRVPVPHAPLDEARDGELVDVVGRALECLARRGTRTIALALAGLGSGASLSPKWRWPVPAWCRGVVSAVAAHAKTDSARCSSVVRICLCAAGDATAYNIATASLGSATSAAAAESAPAAESPDHAASRAGGSAVSGEWELVDENGNLADLVASDDDVNSCWLQVSSGDSDSPSGGSDQQWSSDDDDASWIDKVDKWSEKCTKYKRRYEQLTQRWLGEPDGSVREQLSVRMCRCRRLRTECEEKYRSLLASRGYSDGDAGAGCESRDGEE